MTTNHAPATVRALPRTEPATALAPAHPITRSGLLEPAEGQVQAAYDELARHHVDTLTARERLTDLVASVGLRRMEAEAAAAPAAPKPEPIGDDGFTPTRQEWAELHRMLTIALAVVNGRRGRLRDLFDTQLATAAGRASINVAAERVAAARLATTVTIRRQQAQAIREPKRTVFYVPAIITWDARYRALAASIVRDSHGHYRFTGFTIL